MGNAASEESMPVPSTEWLWVKRGWRQDTGYQLC